MGEDYRVELAAGAWASMPSTVQYSDTENDVIGTDLDFKDQLGLRNQRFLEFHAALRVTSKMKIRLEFIPLSYDQSTTLKTNINFAGQPYLSGQAVSSNLEWSAWRGWYEYDVINGARGFLGASVGVNDVIANATIANASSSVSAHVQIPMPGLGVIARYYPLPRVSITGEVTAYDLPGGSASTHGHGVDIDATAAVNILKYVAIQGGYRAFDVSYVFAASQNTGTLKIAGPYAGVIVRF